MKVCPYSYFRWCGYFQGPWVSFLTANEFSVRLNKNYLKDWCLMNSQPTFLFFDPFLTQWIIAYQKDVNQITLNHTALENLALRIFETFVRILLNVNLSLNQTLLTFLLCVRQNWMTQLILAVSLRKGVFLNLKGFYYSYTWSCSLSLSWDSLSLMGLICRKLLRGFSHVFEWLYFTHFLTSFLYQSPSSPLCTIFDAISSNIDEDLSINSSANVFVFGDFNVRHKDWLTYSGRADKPGELCYNFSISNDLTQTFLLRSLTVTLTVMLFWIYLFILTLLFVLQWLLLHREFLIMLFSQFPWIFPSDPKRDAQFQCIAYDYSRVDWDGLRDYVRDVPWEDIFKLDASAAASEFCEWIQVAIDVYIPQGKYQVKPHSIPWFSVSYAATIVHRNHFFVCTKRINLLNLK